MQALVTDAGERAVGALIREKYELAAEGVRTVSGHAQLCDNNPTLQLVLAMRQVYTAPINFLQARPGLLCANMLPVSRPVCECVNILPVSCPVCECVNIFPGSRPACECANILPAPRTVLRTT